MKVSICCITYNHEKYIAEAIDSFLIQKTDFAFEIIISDDLSLDDTRAICQRYQQKYPDKVKLLLNAKNIGMMSNFFQALKCCKGEYIALCEGDDYWSDENKLRLQVDFLEKNRNYSISYHSCHVLTSGSNFSYNVAAKDFDFCFADSLYGKNGSTVSMLFRRSALSLSSFEFISKDSLVGDWPLELILLLNGSKGHFSARCMAVYRDHPGGITKYRKTSKVKFLENRLLICNELRKIIGYNRRLSFFTGELYLHLLLHKKNSKLITAIKGFGLVSLNFSFRKISNANTSLALSNFFVLLSKRIKNKISI